MSGGCCERRERASEKQREREREGGRKGGREGGREGEMREYGPLDVLLLVHVLFHLHHLIT